MSSRLDELRRHRALLQEHLVWLDREIAAAGGKNSPSPPEVTAFPARLPPTPPSPPLANVAATEADQVFDEFRAEEEKRAAPPSKAGCWSIFLVLLLLGSGLAGGLIYFFYR